MSELEKLTNVRGNAISGILARRKARPALTSGLFGGPYGPTLRDMLVRCEVPERAVRPVLARALRHAVTDLQQRAVLSIASAEYRRTRFCQGLRQPASLFAHCLVTGNLTE
jgi:hypothetical protein